MPIQPDPGAAAFPPEIVAAMSAALQHVCRRLEEHPRPGLMKEVIAEKIIQLVEQGVHNESELRERALAEFDLPRDPGPEHTAQFGGAEKNTFGDLVGDASSIVDPKRPARSMGLYLDSQPGPHAQR
jgi:hypothetical protein